MALHYEQYGLLKKILLLPKKSYGFVQFSNLEQSSAAVKGTDGFKTSFRDVIFYTFYVTEGK